MNTNPNKQVSIQLVLNTWWPLAASWLLMGMELPVMSAIIARLADPEINLAAYGGIVFPLALIIESPIIMLLSASTALSKDMESFNKIWKFMMVTSAALTILHIVTAFTPFYYIVVENIIGAPQEIIEPARIGLKIMLPWTWAIAYRRFNQGVLIRFGHSRAVSFGTAIRLFMNVIILLTGYSIGSISGIILATTAIAVGVTSESIYVGFRVRPIIRDELSLSPNIDPPLTYRAFFQFYLPLAMTSFLLLVVQPIGSAALSRMPQALESLAVWPVVTGVIFLLRGMGIAFNEVVISLIGEKNSYSSLKRFAVALTVVTTLIILIVNTTPIAQFLFINLFALPPELADIAQIGLWMSVLMPGLNALQSWYQGAIMNFQKTRGITEAVVIFITVISVIFWTGVKRNSITGLYVGIAAYFVGMFIQTLWLWYRSLPALQTVKERDQIITTVPNDI